MLGSMVSGSDAKHTFSSFAAPVVPVSTGVLPSGAGVVWVSPVPQPASRDTDSAAVRPRARTLLFFIRFVPPINCDPLFCTKMPKSIDTLCIAAPFRGSGQGYPCPLQKYICL